jgi:hypothetical protein
MRTDDAKERVRQHIRELLEHLVQRMTPDHERRRHEQPSAPGSLDGAVEVEREDDGAGGVGDPEGPA